MSYSLVIDGVIVLLLAVSIYYSVVLKRRLSALRRGEDEMRAKLEEFDAAAARAEQALAGIKTSAAGVVDETVIGHDILKRAEILRDDLKFLVDRGDALIGKAAMAFRPSESVAPQEVPEDTPGSSMGMATRGPSTRVVSMPEAPSQTKGLGKIANLGSIR